MDDYQKQIKIQNEQRAKEIKANNDKILIMPDGLNESEQKSYSEVIEIMKQSIKYKLTYTDTELIWQYCFLKTMRDNAYRKWNEKPEKYIKIVTGISTDGKTPKIAIKENEHYKILLDTSKQLEKILKDLKLTPDMRTKR